MNAHDKVAIVTGAGSGIGKAVAMAFLQEGYRVALAGRRQEALVQAVAEAKASAEQALAVPTDVRDPASVSALFAKTKETFGRLDVLFNNAGIIHRGTILEATEEEFDRTLAVNVKGIFLLSRCAIPVMTRPGGVIVNTASNWGLVGGARAAAYCASKGAVVLLTKAMALDHGPQGIRVNCVCPGDIDTPMLRGEAAQLGQPVDEHLAELAQIPIGRVGRPEDVAEAVLYLASDASAFMTGTPLLIDGGFTAG
jgi:NAD(P)-dependent dehydrogenase (short-subunit alcohol dehydrogenase family)